MLFKANDINRSNYEEFFILYMDNELSADDKVLVEEFLAANPDLQQEMDILLATKLSPEHFSLDNKNDLLADEMKKLAAHDQLLLYIDNELTAEEKLQLEKQLLTEPELQNEYSLLLKTRLDPSEVLSYPNKKELYRQTRTSIPLRQILSVAAVLLLVAFATVFLLNSDTEPTPTFVQNTPKPISKPVAKPEEKVIQPPAPAQNVAAKPAEEKAISHPQKPVPQIALAKKETRKVIEETSPLKEVTAIPVQTEKDAVAALNIPEKKEITTLPVTTEPTATYNNQEVAFEPVKESDKDNGRGKAIRGLLRKATRLIERNTGIAAANDDNQILIGAIAVKLK